MNKKYNVVVIGGGFYGSVLALYFSENYKSVLIVEKEDDLIKRASYNNQARVHNGYHYPRSYLTAIRSHDNYLKFIKDFDKSIYGSFKQYYAIASNLSKTTSQQFFKFAKQIGSPIKVAPDKVKKFFNPSLIDDVFEVEEVVYDARILKDLLKKNLKKRKVDILYKNEVVRVKKEEGNKVACFLKGGAKITAGCVYNCTYSSINQILLNSNLPLLPFKQEFTEMPLIEVPDEFKNLSISVFDGPFFGFLPFPDKKCHSLWHVRYAIRASWVEPIEVNLDIKLKEIAKNSNFDFMLKDAQKYIPLFSKSKYVSSIYETKTVLTQKEENDARPILFRSDYGIENFNIVMGGKIDNIYDILEKIESKTA